MSFSGFQVLSKMLLKCILSAWYNSAAKGYNILKVQLLMVLGRFYSPSEPRGTTIVQHAEKKE